MAMSAGLYAPVWIRSLICCATTRASCTASWQTVSRTASPAVLSVDMVLSIRA